jgi:hypothetical protein
MVLGEHPNAREIGVPRQIQLVNAPPHHPRHEKNRPILGARNSGQMSQNHGAVRLMLTYAYGSWQHRCTFRSYISTRAGEPRLNYVNILLSPSRRFQVPEGERRYRGPAGRRVRPGAVLHVRAPIRWLARSQRHNRGVQPRAWGHHAGARRGPRGGDRAVGRRPVPRNPRGPHGSRSTTMVGRCRQTRPVLRNAAAVGRGTWRRKPGGHTRNSRSRALSLTPGH